MGAGEAGKAIIAVVKKAVSWLIIESATGMPTS